MCIDNLYFISIQAVLYLWLDIHHWTSKIKHQKQSLNRIGKLKGKFEWLKNINIPGFCSWNLAEHECTHWITVEQ